MWQSRNAEDRSAAHSRSTALQHMHFSLAGVLTHLPQGLQHCLNTELKHTAPYHCLNTALKGHTALQPRLDSSHNILRGFSTSSLPKHSTQGHTALQPWLKSSHTFLRGFNTSSLLKHSTQGKHSTSAQAGLFPHLTHGLQHFITA